MPVARRDIPELIDIIVQEAGRDVALRILERLRSSRAVRNNSFKTTIDRLYAELRKS